MGNKSNKQKKKRNKKYTAHLDSTDMKVVGSVITATSNKARPHLEDMVLETLAEAEKQLCICPMDIEGFLKKYIETMDFPEESYVKTSQGVQPCLSALWRIYNKERYKPLCDIFVNFSKESNEYVNDCLHEVLDEGVFMWAQVTAPKAKFRSYSNMVDIGLTHFTDVYMHMMMRYLDTTLEDEYNGVVDVVVEYLKEVMTSYEEHEDRLDISWISEVEPDEEEEEIEEKTRYNYIDSYLEMNSLANQCGFEYSRGNGDHGIFVHKETGKAVVIPQGRKIGKGLSIKLQKHLANPEDNKY